MKNLLLVLLITFVTSCNFVDIAPGVPIDTSIESTVDSPKDSVYLDESKPFSNPAIIYGSDFGNYFRTLYKLGKYDDMIKFTSKESLDEFGEDVVRNFYENEMKFGYEIGKPQSSNSNGDYITLNYNGNIIATKTVVRIVVRIENDSCKIVLPSELENFPS